MAGMAAELHVVPHATTGGWTIRTGGRARVVRDPGRGAAGGAQSGRSRRHAGVPARPLSPRALAARARSGVAQDGLHDERRVVGSAAPVGEREDVLEADPDLAADRHGGVEHRPGGRALRRGAAAARGRTTRSSAASMSRAIATASSAFSERGSTSTRRTWTPLSARISASRGRPHARLDPDPARGDQLGQLAPALLGQVERDEVRRGGPAREISRARASTSPPVIHSPVENESSMPGAAARSARTAAAMSRGVERLVAVAVARVRVQRAPRPRRRTPAPRPPAPSGERGTPVSWSPFRQAWRTMPPGRRRGPAAARRPGTSSACRPTGSARASRRSCPRARPRCRARTGGR